MAILYEGLLGTNLGIRLFRVPVSSVNFKTTCEVGPLSPTFLWKGMKSLVGVQMAAGGGGGSNPGVVGRDCARLVGLADWFLPENVVSATRSASFVRMAAPDVQEPRLSHPLSPST